MNLQEFFRENPKVAVAFSGGVDSAFLLYIAKKYAKNVQAYYVKTEFQPQFELEDAMRLAGELDVAIKILNVDIITDNQITKNTKNRCYYCKKKMFESIKNQAIKDNFFVIVDGTNASDDFADRPGIKALYELDVLSPLRICGLTKEQIRKYSQEAGLFTWNKPAYACLATRISQEEIITLEKLKKIEIVENYLSSLGLENFRVRCINGTAKIQVQNDDIQKIIENREKIIEKFKQYYTNVLLDLEVRK